MKVALVYDRVNKWGGAERVLLALHKMFPAAPLYTSVYSKRTAPWAKVFKIRTSFLNSAGPLRGYNDLIFPLMPVAFESFSFDEYDVVISVTSEAAKGIITKPGTLHICYLLTPTRYLWSGYKEYLSSGLLRLFTAPFISYLRRWDKAAASRPDYFIAISSEVKNRIEKYYNRKSHIIFPPVMIEKNKGSKKTKDDFYLLVSRFSRFSYYKKVDIAIDAFNKLGYPLKVIGTGPLLSSLKSRSKSNIEFLGELTDRELSYYYENCSALIFPGVEDFGLVMAEAQSFGKPVIAYRKGGALDIIEEGITGEFFDKQSAPSLIDTLKKFDEKRYNKADIIRNSQRFSYEVFKSGFEKFIESKLI